MCACLTNAAGFNKYCCIGHLTPFTPFIKISFHLWDEIESSLDNVTQCFFSILHSFFSGPATKLCCKGESGLTIRFKFIFFVICNLQNFSNNVAPLPNKLICSWTLIFITVNVCYIIFSRKNAPVFPSSEYITAMSKSAPSAMDINLGLLPLELLPDFSLFRLSAADFIF